jgi:CubicO group peptidase (beta-lactamase class C family)
MKSILRQILSTVAFLRNSSFILLFLLTGNYHQAVEKQTDSRVNENDLSFMYTQVASFTPDYASFIEQKIDSLLKRRGFNGSVMVAHKGQAVYNKSLGKSRFTQTQEFAENHNIFQLASVGKQFTAVAILMLFDRGLIDLDDQVCKHIEGFPYEDITIRHLLNHTSGLQNYFYVIDNHWKKEHLPTHQDMLDLFIARRLPLNFTPGRRFSYSNSGYAFLAMLVETVSGEKFSDFVQNNIFLPLGMKNSFVFHPDMDLNEISQRMNLSFGYERMGRRLREIPVDYIDGITGDKGIFSCTEDLLKWDNALENDLLLKPQTKALAFDNGRLRSGTPVNYGFGYRLKSTGGQRVVYHNGWWRGFRTAYVRLPENTLIVVLNNTNASVIGLENQIQKLIETFPEPIFAESKLMAIN